MAARVGMVGAVPVCPPERPRSGVSIPKIHTLCAGMNDGCALAGRHGRAHRHRPYQSPSCFSVQSAHNQQALRPRSCNTIHHLEMNERTDATSIIMPSTKFADNIRLLYIVIEQNGGLIIRPSTTRAHHFRTCPMPLSWCACWY